MNRVDYDCIVIGGGGAGYAAASTAAKLGARVAMVERDRLGGTCLNVGCVPTKTLVRSAEVLETVRRAAEFGVEVGDIRLDFRAVKARMRSIIAAMSGEGPEESLREQSIELLRGNAAFIDAQALRVGDRVYRAEQFVIATGSEPVIPPIPGFDAVPCLTSDDLLERDDLPASMLVVGGGIVGCEFASIYNAFGTNVAIVGSNLLSNEDDDVGEELARAFTERGIEVLTGSKATGLRREVNSTLVSIEYGDERTEERPAEVVLLAVGRRPRLDGLNIAAAGVTLSEQGSVEVGPDMATSVPHIWAAGDVTGMHMYTHAGDYMGEVAGWNAAGGTPKREARLAVVPRPVYSAPEVAAIGLTEREANELPCGIEVAKVRFADVSRAVINGETGGWCKIIAESRTGRILGTAIVGPRANELIGEVAVAMDGGVSAWVLGDTLHPYPTVSEIVRWTADQIGKTSHAEDPDIRRPLYSRELAELTVGGSNTTTGVPVTDEQMSALLGVHAGYGEEEDCVGEPVGRK
ncbi:MAG: NAD(P)/FAD-dependent oxidoreductase [Chloroflexia bacterium]|nr:NAD(P)/FAD-dependent oxidoreductase [Chloroflexia bacterium]